jgi:uncharacterized membrane protein
MKILSVIGLVFLVFVLIGAIFSAFALVIMGCWNYALSPLFGLPNCTFLQAVCMFVILGIVGDSFSRKGKSEKSTRLGK